MNQKFYKLKNTLELKITNDLIKTPYNCSWELKKAIASYSSSLSLSRNNLTKGNKGKLCI